MARKRIFSVEEARARKNSYNADYRRRVAAQQEKEQPGKTYPVVIHSAGPVEFVQPPPEVLADREHRARLVHRTTTSAFFNDPLPGYSALDRRRA